MKEVIALESVRASVVMNQRIEFQAKWMTGVLSQGITVTRTRNRLRKGEALKQ